MRRRAMIRSSGVAILALGFACLGATEARAEHPLYKNVAAPVDQRVRDLLGRMTLEEKIAQLQGSLPVPGIPGDPLPTGDIFKDGKFDPAVARKGLANGVGVYTNIAFGSPMLTGLEAARRNNEIQRWVMTNTRLGIPVLFQNEALHGAVANGATVFPQANALGATWDPSLIREMFGVVAKESRAAGVPMVLAPVFDPPR